MDDKLVPIDLQVKIIIEEFWHYKFRTNQSIFNKIIQSFEPTNKIILL